MEDPFKPKSGDYLGHRKATFRGKLLLIGSHIQRITKGLHLNFDTTPDSVHSTNVSLLIISFLRMEY